MSDPVRAAPSALAFSCLLALIFQVPGVGYSRRIAPFGLAR
jgi:hypothetical protein